MLIFCGRMCFDGINNSLQFKKYKTLKRCWKAWCLLVHIHLEVDGPGANSFIHQGENIGFTEVKELAWGQGQLAARKEAELTSYLLVQCLPLPCNIAFHFWKIVVSRFMGFKSSWEEFSTENNANKFCLCNFYFQGISIFFMYKFSLYRRWRIAFALWH